SAARSSAAPSPPAAPPMADRSITKARRPRLPAATGSSSATGMDTPGPIIRFASATELNRSAIEQRDKPGRNFRPGFLLCALLALRSQDYRGELIERSTSALGQQSTLRPADF